jgi:hypothetical protein
MEGGTMNESLPNELAVLGEAHRSLSLAQTVEEVKALRDKAEAARKYAQCARLGLEKQNQCAEFKLSCERKAGRLLIELGIGPGRPGRKKKSHHRTILEDLGINKNQSSRWQRVAQIPEELLQHYIVMALKSGIEITSQGLLRLAQRKRDAEAVCRTATCGAKARRRQERAASVIDEPRSSNEFGDDVRIPGEAIELVAELLNHHGLLLNNLREFCEQEVVRPHLIQRRTVARVLTESKELLTTLIGLLRANIRIRAG